MIFDFQILSRERPSRWSRGHPRHFREPPRLGSLLSSLSEAVQKSHQEEDAEAKGKKDKEAAESAKKNQQQNQRPQSSVRSPKVHVKEADHSLHDDRRAHDKKTSENQKKANREAQGAAAQEGVQDAWENAYETVSQKMHPSTQRSATPTANLLKNMSAMSQGAGSSSSQGLSESERAGVNSADADGTIRLADLNRFSGLQESGALPEGIWKNPAGMRGLMAREKASRSRGFHPDSPFAKLNSGFSHLWNSQSLTKLLTQTAKAFAESHPDLLRSSLPFVAVFHGGLILLKEGDRVRAFRLLEDHTLYEATLEHEGVPLTNEGRSELMKLLKQKGIHARLHGEKEPLTEGGAFREGVRKSAKDHSHLARGDFGILSKDDSSFAKHLREVLEEGKHVEQKLAEGESAQFLPKQDWEKFFSNMLRMGSSEKFSKKNFDDILGLIFRGLFKKEGEEGQVLVSDIQYASEELFKKQDKFAQIGVSQESLLELLKNLRPGEAISKDLMKQFMGEELAFVELLHVIKKADPVLASELFKNVQFDATANVDAYSQARLEHQLFAPARRRRAEEEAMQRFASGAENVPANVYELQPRPKQRFWGSPRFYTFLSYVLVGGGLLLALLFFFTKN